MAAAEQVWQKFNSMRSYIFFSMLVLVAILVAFMLYEREQSAFDRELARVEQSHLVIAQNLASTITRYVDDMKATFDVVIENDDQDWSLETLEGLLSPYEIELLGVLDNPQDEVRVIYSDGMEVPSLEVLKRLKDRAVTGESKITEVMQISGVPYLFVVRREATEQVYFAAFNTSYLISEQKDIAIGELGHSMIVDHLGRVLAHPKPHLALHSVDVSRLPVVKRMMKRETGVMQFFAPPLKADVIAGYTYVPTTGWGVMVPQPIEELWAASSVEPGDLARTLILLCVVAVVASWVLSGMLIQPLRRLSETVKNVRDGDRGSRVPEFNFLVPRELRSMRNFLNDLLASWTHSEALMKDALISAGEANSKKSEAIAVLSHEMRTPLNGILGAISLIDCGSLDASQKKYLDISKQSANTLLGHVNHVLEVSRLENAKVKIKREAFNLDELLSGIVKENTAQAEKCGTTLSLSPFKGVPRGIVTDRSKLQDIVSNLVANAVKFTKGGKVELWVSVTSEGLLDIRVTDTGPGISKTALASIFEPFSVAHSGYDREHEGTGLGLCIAARTTEALGGNISVISNIGKGSEFRALIPFELADRDQLAITKASTEILDRSNQKKKTNTMQELQVLIVDDNEINRIVLEDMCRNQGCITTTANDGDDALRKVKKREFDVIFMDISMPKMDGTEATRRIRARAGPNQYTPIFAQTANASVEDHDRFRDAGIDGVLIKPLSQPKLATTLAQRRASLESMFEETPTSGEQNCLDPETTNSLISAVGRNGATNSINMVISEVRDLISQITTNVDIGSSKESMISKVHNVAGACAIIGATLLQSTLNKIEIRLKQDQMSEVFDLVSETEEALMQTMTEIEVLLSISHTFSAV